MKNKIKNALIPAGGYGTRLRGYKNPRNCKSLILAHDGKTLFEHVLIETKESDVVENVILVTRSELVKELEEIVTKVGLPYSVVVDDKILGVRSYPSLCKNILDNNPFLLMCGHAPPTAKHLQKMVQLRKNDKEQVVSLYTNNIGECIFGELDGTYLKNLNEKEGPGRCRVESPFILTGDLVETSDRDKHKHWLGYNFINQESRGVKFHGLNASFPLEADTPEELDNVLGNLSKRVT